MGERKVLNKYYPPDFDPSLIPRGKKAKNEQHKVRMMVPFSVRYEFSKMSQVLTLKGAFPVENTLDVERSLMPERRQSWEKNTLESKSSVST